MRHFILGSMPIYVLYTVTYVTLYRHERVFSKQTNVFHFHLTSHIKHKFR